MKTVRPVPVAPVEGKTISASVSAPEAVPQEMASAVPGQ